MIDANSNVHEGVVVESIRAMGLQEALISRFGPNGPAMMYRNSHNIPNDGLFISAGLVSL